MIDAWINKESRWNVESIESQYINISTYRPLSGSFIHELTCWIKKSKKRTNPSKTKIKNVFYVVMLDILILQKNIRKELKKLPKKLLKSLIMMELNFPCIKKILARLRWKTIYALTYWVTKMSWFFQFMFQITHLKVQWICCFSLMMINHICTSKIMTDLCFEKHKIKTKIGSSKVVYSVLGVKCVDKT